MPQSIRETVAAAALATTGLVACSNESDDTADNAAGNNGDNVTVKIGTTEADPQGQWSLTPEESVAEGLHDLLGEGHAPGLQADHRQIVEPVVGLDDLVGHAPDRPPNVLGVEHLGPGNENAPERGRAPAFSFSHVGSHRLGRCVPLGGLPARCPYGPHGTRFTVSRSP